MGRLRVNSVTAETCEVLWNEVGRIYLSVMNEGKWNRILKDFPNCVGVIDGKRISIKSAPNSSSLYFILALLASCDANYKFINLDIG